MPTINEMIDFCEDLAAYDCFSNEQFARREMFYAIADELKKQNNLCENLAWYINERQRLLKEIARACADRLPDDELSFDPARPWRKWLHCYERTGIRTQFCPDCGYKMRCQEDG